MADSPGTIEKLALVLGKMLHPLATRLESGDVLGLLGELGLALPPSVLTTEPGFATAIQTGGAAAGALPDIISSLITAIEADDGAGAVEAAVKLIEAAAKVISSFDTIASELKTVPGVDPAFLQTFAGELPGKLLDYVVITFLESFNPVLASTAALLGLIERGPKPGLGGDPTQPPYIARSLDLSRFGDFLHSPGDL